jgi:succinate dehydrogenase/fumarate reductase cytochrome b subunit
MDLFDNPLFRIAFLLIAGLLLAGLLYFVFVGLRALFRQARQIAREAGYREGSAAVRATLRMAIWALFFVLFYLFAFFVGKRLGWWALPPAVAGVVLMIAGLLLADKLLTVRPRDIRAQSVVGGTLVSLMAVFIVAIALAA